MSAFLHCCLAVAAFRQFIHCVMPFSDYPLLLHSQCLSALFLLPPVFVPGIKVLLSWKTGTLFKLLFDDKKNGDISWAELQKHKTSERKQDREHKWTTLFCIHCVAHITRAYTKSTQKLIWDQTNMAMAIDQDPLHTQTNANTHARAFRDLCKSSEYCRMNFHKSHKILMQWNLN